MALSPKTPQPADSNPCCPPCLLKTNPQASEHPHQTKRAVAHTAPVQPRIAATGGRAASGNIWCSP